MNRAENEQPGSQGRDTRDCGRELNVVAVECDRRGRRRGVGRLRQSAAPRPH